MSGLKLKLCLALAALVLPTSAIGQCRGCDVVVGKSGVVPLRDTNGNVLATINYFAGVPGKRLISFFDANNYLINTVTEAPQAAGGPNPLSGAQIPDVMGPDGEKADGPDDIQWLKDQIRGLKAQVRLLNDRINAAAAK